ncbi:hypothetical protein MKX03_010846 [Papaver bracteatum]|nr:hypothetical protein MKX03_010846 [Papaver bracteatum]
MAGSRNCRWIALILIAFFVVSNSFICNAKVQFTCSYSDVLRHYGIRTASGFVVDHQSLITAGYERVENINDLVYTFVRNHGSSALIYGKCYGPIDCDRKCFELANTRADKNTGRKGNCANDDVSGKSFCTCCVA